MFATVYRGVDKPHRGCEFSLNLTKPHSVSAKFDEICFSAVPEKNALVGVVVYKLPLKDSSFTYLL